MLFTYFELELIVKKYLYLFLAMVLLVAALVFIKRQSCQLSIDGYKGELAKLIMGGEDTKYAAAYSDSGFLKIRTGMNAEEVIEILGEPLVKWFVGIKRICYQYTESPSSTHYRLRQVHVTDGKVTEVIGYFYVD